jgi:protein SCO1/2
MPRTLLASALVCVAGACTLAAGTDGFRAFTTETARRVAVRAHPVRLPDIELETARRERTSLSQWRGRWLVVDFVYTRCATLCTAQGAELAQLQDRLAAPIARGRVQLLSVSFDPAHDAPDALAGYLRRSGDRGTGWVASRPIDAHALERLLQAFGVVVIPDGAGGFIHNAALQLVDPQGRLVEILDGGDPASIAREVASRLAQEGSAR